MAIATIILILFTGIIISMIIGAIAGEFIQRYEDKHAREIIKERDENI